MQRSTEILFLWYFAEESTSLSGSRKACQNPLKRMRLHHHRRCGSARQRNTFPDTSPMRAPVPLAAERASHLSSHTEEFVSAPPQALLQCPLKRHTSCSKSPKREQVSIAAGKTSHLSTCAEEFVSAPPLAALYRDILLAVNHSRKNKSPWQRKE